MELLTEILRVEGLQLEGPTIFREAVRGIIINGNKLLMIHPTKKGGFKFPGGGILAGESHSEALAREVREESGAILTQVQEPFGKVIEYGQPIELDAKVFKMTSYYYFCQIESLFAEQCLDKYELDLGFMPIWVDVETAIQNNMRIKKFNPPGDNRQSEENLPWLSREIFILNRIKKRLFTSLPTNSEDKNDAIF